MCSRFTSTARCGTAVGIEREDGNLHPIGPTWVGCSNEIESMFESRVASIDLLRGMAVPLHWL
jgi:hypothetical protein